MNQKSSNALLPPMEDEDFQNSFICHFLQKHEEYLKIFNDYLSIDSLRQLEYVPNPAYITYTPYGQDDFDEIYDFIRYNGVTEKPTHCLENLPDFSFSFSMKNTFVGKFVVCKKDGKVIGILNPK